MAHFWWNCTMQGAASSANCTVHAPGMVQFALCCLYILVFVADFFKLGVLLIFENKKEENERRNGNNQEKRRQELQMREK